MVIDMYNTLLIFYALCALKKPTLLFLPASSLPTNRGARLPKESDF